jgi:hypothetical protein
MGRSPRRGRWQAECSVSRSLFAGKLFLAVLHQPGLQSPSRRLKQKLDVPDPDGRFVCARSQALAVDAESERICERS